VRKLNKAFVGEWRDNDENVAIPLIMGT